jgi:hypothetical protein
MAVQASRVLKLARACHNQFETLPRSYGLTPVPPPAARERKGAQSYTDATDQELRSYGIAVSRIAPTRAIENDVFVDARIKKKSRQAQPHKAATSPRA